LSKEAFYYETEEDADFHSKTASIDLWSTSLSFARSSYTPSIRMPTTSFNATFTAKFGKELKVKFKNKTITGYYTKTGISKKYVNQVKPAYGYMYFENANADANAMLDFNRINDGSYTKKTPIISMPVYTYDVFSITGEGTGGNFRGYRGDLGYVRDAYTRTSSGKLNVFLELGLKKIFHGGTNIGGVYSRSFVQNWEKQNKFKDVAKFGSSDRDVQRGFYFKNPGEKAIIDEEYYNNMGEDKLMRLTMYAGLSGDAGPPYLKPTTTLNSRYQLYQGRNETLQKIDLTTDNTFRKKRDKRTQVISFLTAKDADYIGFDRHIKSFPENNFALRICPPNEPETNPKDFFKNDIIRRVPYDGQAPSLAYRKKNHISEVTVQEGSKRYIYGLPVYELAQSEVVMSVEPRPVDAFGQVPYQAGVTNSTNNKEGKDGLFQKETLDPFPHSFLLTAILSPDYTDVTGNGVSDDDPGTAIKFNYSRVGNDPSNGANSWKNMNWRLPVAENNANYNRGLVTDNEDDKATYIKGEKELWYMHSIESKNMVATFSTSNRDDGWGVKNTEDGGILTSASAPCQKKLDKINLYSKADIVKYGIANAKPIKTVHFTYSYRLCKGYNVYSGNGIKGNGKLTLESIYFTYNNNNHQKNKYLFKYTDEGAGEKDYNPTQYDRWGTYKASSQNPGSASNEDYPYTNRNKTLSDNYAAAWSLNKILLPSGAKIDITYEADDYAYVQDKRAAELTPILGFGLTKTAQPEADYLYNRNPPHRPWSFGNTDYRYVFFNAPVPVRNETEVRNLYLKDFNQLLLKLFVKVPGGSFSGVAGFEPMFVYCEMDEVGVVESSLNSLTGLYSSFYVKIGKAKRNSGSQIMETVYQFLRNQLPGKAYPGYDVKKKSGVGQLVRALFAMVNNIRTGVTGFENNARWDGWCKQIDPTRSGARLSNPYFKKLGGGHRVKKVVITDNWKKMSKPNEPAAPEIDSYYGQEYNYTTTEIVNGQPQVISSGVASYEPGLGNDENPFREILQYGKQNLLAPSERGNVELPIAETFFPSSSVGYSRVTVKSIHGKNTVDPATNKNIKSGVGMQETEFYTTKDFPTLTEFTGFGPRSRHGFNPKPIAKIFNFASKDYLTLTQGFKVVQNDMNGKIKKQASYAETDLNIPINATIYHYRMNKTGENKFRLNNIVPTIGGPDGKIVNKLVGKDIEVMNDLREHFSHTRSLQIPLNVEFFTAGAIPIIIPTIFRSAFRDESLFRSATTLKVVNEYGILDSIENIDKGSIISTKNLLYNAETGDVLVSRTKNEFNKPIYNFNYPAYWAFDEMGPAYKNIDATFKGLTFRRGKIDAGLTQEEVNKYFVSGDEIFVMDKATAPLFENPNCNATCANTLVLPQSSEFKIWALDVTKDTRNTTKEIIFIDRHGNPYNAGNADIRIVRSGRRNMMDASVGSVTSLESPIKYIPNTTTFDKIEINNATNVINSGAMEYKEKWKTQDAFNVVRDTTVETKRAPIGPPIQLFPFRGVTAVDNERDKTRQIEVREADHFIARKDRWRNSKSGSRNSVMQKSWLQFDLSGLSNNANIQSAILTLFGHNIPHSFNYSTSSSIQGHNRSRRDQLPHLREYSKTELNIAELSRMKINSWPASLHGWRNQFNYSNLAFGHDRMDVFVPMAPGTSSNFNFTSQSNPRLDVKDLLQHMLIDNADPSKQFIKGAFRIAYPTDPPWRAGELRMCFDNRNFGNLRPMLQYSEVNCGAAYGPGNPEPTNPPPPYGVGTCTNTTITTTCVSIFNGSYINPYVRGLLGNWRPLRSYVYYGERREQNANSVTNIAKDGVIKDFETYWALDEANNKQITKTNSTKWTWNSEITQYNRKGAELENRDPLNRHNASIYGYNEALPIAVVNNSKLRESGFDGFEDYRFDDLSCPVPCNPNKRHFDSRIVKENVVQTQAHTGKHSYRVYGSNYGNDNFAKFRMPLGSENNAANANTPDIRIGVSHPINPNSIALNAATGGLIGTYNSNGILLSTRLDPQINFAYNIGNVSNMPTNWNFQGENRIEWNGFLLVNRSGAYRFFSISTRDRVIVNVNGNRVYEDGLNTSCGLNPTANGFTVNLVSGTIYTINVQFCDNRGSYFNRGRVNLMWQPPCGPEELVPQQNLYPTLAAAQACLPTAPNTSCTVIDQIKPLANFLVDDFKPVYNKKMVASVWVKQGETDCRCPQYTGFNMTLRDENGTTVSTLAPKSPIIEGWQLFEAEFTTPSTGAFMELYVVNNITDLLYVDDLRIHPYNANMKSFVYNPYNLKPEAELDENNYATFYEYDNDGTLVRVKKETKLGVKTIQETRSSLQKVVSDF
jgi:hypothetical protein